MKRRNFLRLLALSPLALIVPKVFMSDWHVYDDAIPIIRADPFPSNRSWANCDNNGGFLVPQEMADELLQVLHKRHLTNFNSIYLK